MLFPNIEAEKARNGLKTDAMLAAKLEVSPRTVSNWMSGKTDIPATYLVRMANMWECSTDYLLGRTKHPTIEAS